MQIIGRQREKRELQRYFESGRPELLVVYGRRRVGKTYLVKEYFDNNFDFYFTGLVGETKKGQLRNFDQALREYGHRDTGPSKDWSSAFARLRELLQGKMGNGRCIVFIDELPWLGTPRSGFVEAFDYFWNSWASAQPAMMLIVCGSAASWIAKKIFSNRGGLHNRVTGKILLEPFSLHDCEEFFASRGVVMNRYQQLESYMVFGGIPYYLDLFDKSFGLSQNIDRLCFANEAMLKDEFMELYRSLFTNFERHIKIVETLARKPSGMTRDEIIASSKIPAGGHLSAALTELEQCGLIERYSDFQLPRNGGYYRLIDQFTLFYLRFMRHNNDKDENFWTNYLEDGGHRAWSGLAFEQVCMRHIPQIKAKLGIQGVSTLTRAWRSRNSTPGAQIDLLLDRRDSVINLCEMKYTKHPFTIDSAYDKDLQRKRSAFQEETGTVKALHLTMVTTYGLARKGYFASIQSEVIMDDLFAL
ncbi:MAG: AAA family ATPase [Propionibacteriaceae bacterium]|nr:AAA family ATPase [Propionibacteriaceae bacterium]